MSEDRDSLAEQAAAWVPPWARTKPDPSAEPDAAVGAVGPVGSDAEPVAPVGLDAPAEDASAEPADDLLADGEPDLDVVAEHDPGPVGSVAAADTPLPGDMSPAAPKSEMSPDRPGLDLDAAGEFDVAVSAGAGADESIGADPATATQANALTSGDMSPDGLEADVAVSADHTDADVEELTRADPATAANASTPGDMSRHGLEADLDAAGEHDIAVATDADALAETNLATATATAANAWTPGDMSPATPESEMSPAGESVTAEPAPLALIDDDEMRGALEAILLVVDEPVQEIMLAQIMEQPTDRVAETLHALAESYEQNGHGFELRRVGGGWRLYTRPRYAEYVQRFVLDGQSVRLTQAALETLAVVAYKQPVTRSRISAIRGVNCDGVIRTLTSRGLVEECGTEPESGAFLYRTTTLFLEKLGLDTVDQLPPLAPFLPDDIDEVADAGR